LLYSILPRLNNTQALLVITNGLNMDGTPKITLQKNVYGIFTEKYRITYDKQNKLTQKVSLFDLDGASVPELNEVKNVEGYLIINNNKYIINSVVKSISLLINIVTLELI
jgi:hypothetical protein